MTFNPFHEKLNQINILVIVGEEKATEVKVIACGRSIDLKTESFLLEDGRIVTIQANNWSIRTKNNDIFPVEMFAYLKHC